MNNMSFTIKRLKDIERYQTYQVKDRVSGKDSKPTWLLVEELLAVACRRTEICFRSSSQMDQKEMTKVYNHVYELEVKIERLEATFRDVVQGIRNDAPMTNIFSILENCLEANGTQETDR